MPSHVYIGHFFIDSTFRSDVARYQDLTRLIADRNGDGSGLATAVT